MDLACLACAERIGDLLARVQEQEHMIAALAERLRALEAELRELAAQRRAAAAGR